MMTLEEEVEEGSLGWREVPRPGATPSFFSTAQWTLQIPHKQNGKYFSTNTAKDCHANTNTFSVVFQIQDTQRNPDSATALITEFCHLLLTWIYKTLILHILYFSSTFHMLLSYVIVIEIVHGLWLCLQGLLPTLQIALNCDFSSCGFTMGTALYWTAFGCTNAHCSLHWWAHSEKGSAALSEKGSAAAFLNWLLMMGAGTLSANYLIHTSGNSQPNMSCRL